MNDPAEIPTDLSSDELAERLEAALEGVGWILGHSDETPHQARLYYRPRTRTPSYDLAGMSPAAEHDVVEAVAQTHGGRVAYLTDMFIEWRGGRQVILLGRNAVGHYHDVRWGDIRETGEGLADLPAEVLAGLRASPPDADRMIAALTDHLYGEPAEPDAGADVALLEAYHPFDASWREVLEPLFLEVRRRLAAASEGEELEVPGLAMFRRLDSERGVFEAVHRPEDALREFFSGERSELAVDLGSILGGAANANLGRALADACARARDGRVDVLVGADLALHTAVYPPYEGVNPRTGEAIVIPGSKRPVFIGW